jgi:hypothetical protein
MPTPPVEAAPRSAAQAIKCSYLICLIGDPGWSGRVKSHQRARVATRRLGVHWDTTAFRPGGNPMTGPRSTSRLMQRGRKVFEASGDLPSSFHGRTDDREQERALREVAAHSAHEIVAVYRDGGSAVQRAADKRPGFDAMHQDASPRELDIVMVWSVDRLGRSPLRVAQPWGSILPYINRASTPPRRPARPCFR